jgi:hypothetical protein
MNKKITSRAKKQLTKEIEFVKLYNRQFPITDYHDFTWPSCSIEHRRKLDVGDIYINAVICNLCNFFVRSRNRHDCVSCKCGSVSVDGGSWYARRNGDSTSYKDVIVMFDNVRDSSVK